MSVDFESAADTVEEQRTDGEGGFGDDVAYVGTPNIDLRPPTLLTFDEVLSVSFTGDVSLEQNLRGAGHYTDEGSVVITVRNPTVEEGDIFASTDDEQFNDLRIVNQSEDDAVEDAAEKTDGEWETVGISISGNDYYAEEADSLDDVVPTLEDGDITIQQGEDEVGVDEARADPDDRVVSIWAGSKAAETLLRQADIHGGVPAEYQELEDGTIVNSRGLIEYHPDSFSDDFNPSDDGYPRVARFPSMREDFVGQEMALLYHFGDEYDGNKQVFADFLLVEDGETIAVEPPREEGDAGYAEPEYGASLVWHDADDPEEATTADEAPDSFEEATSTDTDDAVIDGYDDLPSDAQEIVDEAEANGLMSDDITDFDENVREQTEVDPNVVAAILDDRVGE